MKIQAKPLLAGLALASLWLAGTTLPSAHAQSTSAGGVEPPVANCNVDDFADAPAATYCTGATVSESGSATDACDVAASCSVEFEYGPGGTNYTITVTLAASTTVDHDDVEEIVLCIRPPQATQAAPDPRAGHGYTAAVRVSSCNSGEKTAAEAEDGGFVTSVQEPQS